MPSLCRNGGRTRRSARRRLKSHAGLQSARRAVSRCRSAGAGIGLAEALQFFQVLRKRDTLSRDGVGCALTVRPCPTAAVERLEGWYAAARTVKMGRLRRRRNVPGRRPAQRAGNGQGHKPPAPSPWNRPLRDDPIRRRAAIRTVIAQVSCCFATRLAGPGCPVPPTRRANRCSPGPRCFTAQSL